ncbi:hypothetical protein [Ruminococcus flavefaciens]|uniref:hypothetical protein n=1 Tax=Ruminococcus flavefaciens TaxID=1265 RepID=UPI00048FF724|nr:hypothetical protein [Ruminococcus flavefaciens]
MLFKNDTLQVSVPFDENEWKAQPNFQGSFVTLFERSEAENKSSLSVMVYPNNTLSMQQIYLNTVLELRKMLKEFSVKPNNLNDNICEFEYEGKVQDIKMKFCQRIFRSNVICSITGGCSAELAENRIPKLKQLTEQITVSERS